MSKLERRNQAKQLRQHHHAQKDNELHIFQGKEGAPRHVAVIPLHPTIDIKDVIERLNKNVDVKEANAQGNFTRVHVERFRRNIMYMPSTTHLLHALDICRLADWVILVLPADEALGSTEDELLRTIEGQGITNVVVVVQGLEASVPVARRSKHVAQLKADLSIYFPTLEKINVLDNTADCASLVRSLCTATTKGIRWRDERSWMLVEDITWDETVNGFATSHVNVTGIVRGKNMNPDRIVHVPGWGDFQVGKITEIAVQKHKRKADEMVMEHSPREWLSTEQKDDLVELAPEETNMVDTTSTMATSEQKGVLLDDHHYFSDDNSHIPLAPKKLPKGTSSYQAAWYLDDMSDSDSDILDDEDNNGDLVMDTVAELGPEDGIVTNVGDAMTEGGPTEYAESEMHVDANPEEEQRALEEYRANRKDEATDDLEFPDEIELSPHVLARERLAKYRGLKDLRRSEWNTEEDAPFEPLEYGRLLQIADYKKSKNAAVKETLAGGVPVGTRVVIQLMNVPMSIKSSPTPVSLFSLLRHEHKHTVVNLNLTLHSSATQPLRSKEELVVQIGARRLVVNPVYSAGGVTPNDVHKFDRFLHPGRTATASFVGPMTWGSVPVLVFKPYPTGMDNAPELVDAMATNEATEQHLKLALVGTATTIPPSNRRIIAKRVILTGHPYKIHKKLVTIRYMFFNTEDVAWFKALPLWTKRGRQGFIKESLGTHGYFKATFDGKINPMDAVGVSLYKRVWPRTSRPYVAGGRLNSFTTSQME
jgi:pre-rRNA-processing protein TSR1